MNAGRLIAEPVEVKSRTEPRRTSVRIDKLRWPGKSRPIKIVAA